MFRLFKPTLPAAADPDSLLSLHCPRRMGRVNWLGLRELYRKEVRRFTKIWLQTVAAPLTTSLLFLAVFVLALEPAPADAVGFAAFLVPGLAMMTITQNAFANTSSSVVIAKVQGTIVDVLMPPLQPLELLIGFAGAGVTRGVAVGTTAVLGMSLFVPTHFHAFGIVMLHALGASLMMSLLGIIVGLWSEKFDHLAAATNFIVAPLSFLSGTFYTIERLPPDFQFLAHLNPLFYTIDGFRYGFIGQAGADPFLGLAVVGASCLLLGLAAYLMIRSGYKIKA